MMYARILQFEGSTDSALKRGLQSPARSNNGLECFQLSSTVDFSEFQSDNP